ncbi:hypothetical protein HDU76_000199, partial [Blyttiomyces sp. JEL0837]
MIKTTLLDSIDEFISKSKGTILSEYSISRCLDWLVEYEDLDLDFIEMIELVELIMNKALQANYMVLFQHCVKLLREFG